MSIFQAFLLGIVQGFTEFLPISSSGHLVLAETWLQFKASQFLFFDVLLHLGTLLAVCIYFRARIYQLGKAILSFFFHVGNSDETQKNQRLLVAIIVSTIVTGSIGMIFYKQFEQVRDSMVVLGVCFLATGTLLISTLLIRDRGIDLLNDYSYNIWVFAVILGIAQGFAILPGISRSGATICIALLLGISRGTAVEYSFLMSIPAILAAGLIELKNAEWIVGPVPALVGFISSVVAGFVSLWILVLIVNKGKLHHFAYYVLPLGVLVLWYTL